MPPGFVHFLYDFNLFFSKRQKNPKLILYDKSFLRGRKSSPVALTLPSLPQFDLDQ